jgi:LacI family transcriptional regulator
MLHRVSRVRFTIVLIPVLLAATVVCASAAEFRITKDDSTFSISDGNRLVLRYRCTNVPNKPYVDQLFSPAGVQVLRDSPHDHKHHHGLMYAMEVDGVNFWEEVPNSGRQRQKSIAGDVTHDQGVSRFGFVQELDWMGPASDKPMLVERRAIGVLRANDLRATLLQWHCRLATPPGKDAVVLGGHHYFGLGMRFLTSMDADGHFIYADDKPGEVVMDDQRLTPTKWCVYAAKADGKPVTMAIFDHPANLCHPAKMFTMSKPFAYLSATLNAWKEPVTIQVGKPLDLRYGVAVWDGWVDGDEIGRLYRRWLTISAKAVKN